MKRGYHIKTFDTISSFRKAVWLIVPFVSIAGFAYPKLGLFIFPLFATIMVMGFFTGRYWCGNFCPRGSFFDLPVRRIAAFAGIPRIFKTVWFRGLILVLLMGFFTRNTVNAFSLYGSTAFLDRLGMAGVMMCAVTTTIGLIFSFTINPRSWCTFCPMGTVQKMLHSLRNMLPWPGLINPRVTMSAPSACQKCGKCERVCPMQLAPYRELDSVNQVAAPDCIKCATCVSHCPAKLLTMEKQQDPKKYSTPLPLCGYAERKPADAVIENIMDIGNDIREFTFRLEGGAALSPGPGQFITVRVDDTNERFRSYSVSMPSDDPSRVKIAVKLDRNGWGSPRLFRMKVGDSVRLEGPMGDFTIADQGRDSILIAGGIGITPFLSLARYAARKNPSNRVHVVYGANTPGDVIYRDYLDDLKKEHSNFDYTITLSSPGEAWDGSRGLVTDVLGAMELGGKEAYLCGSMPMIEAVTAKLSEKGLPASSVHVEAAF